MGRHLDPDPEWTAPIKPAGTDRFGPFFELDLDDGATELPTSSTAATRRIPAPTSPWISLRIGHEVWYLSGHTDADQVAKYLLPIQAGVGHGRQPVAARRPTG